jgi:hypothetical protein
MLAFQIPWMDCDYALISNAISPTTELIWGLIATLTQIDKDGQLSLRNLTCIQTAKRKSEKHLTLLIGDLCSHVGDGQLQSFQVHALQRS